MRRLGRRPPAPPAPPPERYDAWLEAVHGEQLARLDRAGLRDLDDDLWALLLTQQYDVFPHVKALLPGVPEPALQEIWNGASGARQAAQSLAFYRVLRPLIGPGDRVLDFGCGWGRLTRFLLRDVEPGRLYGCDPVEGILDQCRRDGLPATLARNDPHSGRLPFDERFDLAFAFSVFTHLSEPAHERALDALHAGLRPGGTLVVTVRPPHHLGEPGDYVFRPHPPDDRHPQWDGGEMHYGDTVITLDYVRERWAPRFELRAAKLLVGDLHQVVLILRRDDDRASP
jgi:SAM-dependent methyltransferase